MTCFEIGAFLTIITLMHIGWTQCWNYNAENRVLIGRVLEFLRDKYYYTAHCPNTLCVEPYFWLLALERTHWITIAFSSLWRAVWCVTLVHYDGFWATCWHYTGQCKVINLAATHGCDISNNPGGHDWRNGVWSKPITRFHNNICLQQIPPF